jgi:hypothetical protein
MNDFNEIENELKKLRPIEPSADLVARVERELAGLEPNQKVVTPDRFRINWLSLGAGLAAAAALLLFVHLRLDRSPQPQTNVAATSPAQQLARPGESVPWRTRSTIVPPEFVPAGATQVVYRTEDEGLLFPNGSAQPVRRVRASMRETLQWQNRTTGASLRVSYPTEEVSLVPVYGQ